MKCYYLNVQSQGQRLKECLKYKYMSEESVRSRSKFVFDLNMSCVVPN